MLTSLAITDKIIYYIDESSISDFHDEVGFYVDVIYSDGQVDTFGPYETKQDAQNI